MAGQKSLHYGDLYVQIAVLKGPQDGLRTIDSGLLADVTHQK